LRLIGVEFVKEIVLPKGYTAKVDDEDFEWLSASRWRAHVCGGRYARKVYVVRSFTEDGISQSQSMHRLILGLSGDRFADHVDGDGLNNQRTNLRTCTRQQNQRNRKREIACNGQRCASEFKGVTFERGWRARIAFGGGERRYLGRYQTECAAALAYDEAARTLFGEFAALNFPRQGEAAA